MPARAPRAATPSPSSPGRRSNEGVKALIVRVDSPGGSVTGVRTHPPVAARGQGQEYPGRGVDGQCRRIGRLLGLDAGRFHLRRASTITGSIGVFGVIPSFQGTLAKLGRRRRRRQDDAPVGRAGPVQGPFTGGRAADPDQHRIDLPRGSSASSPSRATRRRSKSTRSPRAACGTAGPRASSGWSTASAG